MTYEQTDSETVSDLTFPENHSTAIKMLYRIYKIVVCQTGLENIRITFYISRISVENDLKQHTTSRWLWQQYIQTNLILHTSELDGQYKYRSLKHSRYHFVSDLCYVMWPISDLPVNLVVVERVGRSTITSWRKSTNWSSLLVSTIRDLVQCSRLCWRHIRSKTGSL